MAMLARWECGITKKHPETRVDCAIAHALQFAIETGGSVHGTVGAVARERSRQTDMAVREVDAQYVDAVASVVSIIHFRKVTRGLCICAGNVSKPVRDRSAPLCLECWATKLVCA